MHHVNDSLMPLRRTATGWRWRNTLDMMAMTRVRRSRGTPWRKIAFQSWELRTQLSGPVIKPMFPRPLLSSTGKRSGFSLLLCVSASLRLCGSLTSYGNKAVRIVPLPEFLPEDPALVDHQKAVFDSYGEALQGPGGGAFEVDAVDVVPRAVAGALELLVAGQPARHAAQVGADYGEGDQLVVARREVDDPETRAAVGRAHPGFVHRQRLHELLEAADPPLLARLLEHLGAEEVLEHGQGSGGGGGHH